MIGTSLIGFTLAYAAPEQMLGREPRRASDQYSLALVFCSMLEGRVFEERYQPRPFSRLTEEQNRGLLRALDDSPEQRFGTCAEFVQALEGMP